VDGFLVVLITVPVPIFISTYYVPLKTVEHNPVFCIFLALVHITVVHITSPLCTCMGSFLIALTSILSEAVGSCGFFVFYGLFDGIRYRVDKLELAQLDIQGVPSLMSQ
jgi:hypothetical protein